MTGYYEHPEDQIERWRREALEAHLQEAAARAKRRAGNRHERRAKVARGKKGAKA